MNKELFNEYKKLGFNNIPLYKELILDTQTALGIYLKIANNNYSYLFESVEGGEKWGRYSIIGLQASCMIKVYGEQIVIDDDNGKNTLSVNKPLDFINNYINKFRTPKINDFVGFSGGFVGYFGYETIQYIEPKIKCNNKDILKIPDIFLMLSKDLIVFDNLKNKVLIITHINPEINDYEDGLSTINNILDNLESNIKQGSNIKTNYEFKSNINKDNYTIIVNKIKKYIREGDCMQVVPSHCLSSRFENHPIELYRMLRIINPSPYMYYLNFDDFTIVGSSPEILVKVDKNIATLKPIAGTRPRGKNDAEDKAFVASLLADTKEIAEHLMLIDLGRNDLGKIARIGSVKVTNNMEIEKYSHVMHIVSTIECEINNDLSNIDVLKAVFPAGTLSGAPKIRAMEIIEELENSKRGVYGGAIGYLGFNGNMDMAIAIRTAVIKNKTIFVQAGGGVVHDSIAKKEWEETLHKAGAIISSCEQIS